MQFEKDLNAKEAYKKAWASKGYNGLKNAGIVISVAILVFVVHEFFGVQLAARMSVSPWIGAAYLVFHTILILVPEVITLLLLARKADVAEYFRILKSQKFEEGVIRDVTVCSRGIPSSKKNEYGSEVYTVWSVELADGRLIETRYLVSIAQKVALGEKVYLVHSAHHGEDRLLIFKK